MATRSGDPTTDQTETSEAGNRPITATAIIAAGRASQKGARQRRGAR